jgi:hypothetical protein
MPGNSTLQPAIVPSFVYRCPNMSLEVQSWLANEFRASRRLAGAFSFALVPGAAQLSVVGALIACASTNARGGLTFAREQQRQQRCPPLEQ